MAYGNNFFGGYPSYYPQYQAQQQPQGNNLIWVQGEAGAKSYLVAPNTTVQLWDSERQTIYLKSADASGMPQIKILDYTIRAETQNNAVVGLQPQSGANPYKSDFDSLQEQINALKSEIDNMKKGATNEPTL